MEKSHLRGLFMKLKSNCLRRIYVLPAVALVLLALATRPSESGEPVSGEGMRSEPESNPYELEFEGKFRIVPRISAGFQADSNFFKSETNEQEVFTYSVKPGIELGYETVRSSIMLDYMLGANFYDYRDEKSLENDYDERDDYIGHDMTLAANTTPFDRLTIGLTNRFSKTEDSARADRYGNFTERENITVNSLEPSIIYRFGERFTARTGYRNKITKYERQNVNDSVEHRGLLKLYYNLTRKLSVNLQYDHWRMDYDGDTVDYDSDQIGLYFNRHFKHFGFMGGAGYHYRSFKTGEPGDMETFQYIFMINWQNPPIPNPDPRTAFNLTIERNFNDYSGTGNNYYETTEFGLSASRIFLEKIPTSLSFEYKIFDYEEWVDTDSGSNETRKDDSYEISAEAGYVFSNWLTVKASAGHEERDSNFTGYSYKNNYLMIMATGIFDLGSK